ncbi:MAG TPA: AAA family ATPase [Candidatus Saccharimonadales bacterium]|nr:AAA family ATPase [Candidatus Saccharimonadales bacterium]
MENFDLHHSRARKARLGKRIGSSGYYAFMLGSAATLLGGAAFVFLKLTYGYSLAGAGLLIAMPGLWWRYELSTVPVRSDASGQLMDRLTGEVLRTLRPGTTYSPSTLWQALSSSWQLSFIAHHLLIPDGSVASQLSTDPAALPAVLQEAVRIADSYQSPSVEAGHIAVAALRTSPAIAQELTQLKLTPDDLEDVSAWLGRQLDAIRQKPASYGGIGRDWASGYTPDLDRFGHNISTAIEQHGAHFGALVNSPGVQAMKAAFSHGDSTLALIGPDGIGKTSHAYALAQNVLAESQDRTLEHKQIIALDASNIVSAARQPGELEYILSGLLSEAVHAGNIILFFDDAQLFFHTGPGSLDATQILLPVVQARVVQIVLAMSPHDYESLRATNMALAGLLTPVVLHEPDQHETLDIVADTATRFEIRHRVLITFEAIKAAYQLSGRYEADMAYPGKAIRLLEQSLTHSEQGIVTATSVEAAIEQTRGVKAGSAKPAEAAQLLHLEEAIHQRMINQKRAVAVVAAALRRARAGVASPNRPIGSFLFLGPTGVGKTELAKAIAATYFGDEASMIRLDMSEYQQESDVARLLSDGQSETNSLILQVRQHPFSVVLLDEIEKAHPNILNLLLQLLDEGQLTDVQGRHVSFRDCVIITTSNAGADSIRAHIEAGEQLEQFEKQFTDELINSGQFRPELLNRYDEIVLFRPLTPDELAQVVRLMLGGINKTLSTQNITVELTDAAIAKIVAEGNDPRLGARPMRRALQRAVENTVAEKILRGEARPGDHLTLDAPELTL